MTINKVALGLILALGVGALSACKSDEEKAQEHYQSGVELLQSGDVDRALVEFRNVFQLDSTHRDARIAYAQAVRERGDLREAYSQYLRLVEQYPEDLEGNRALTEISMETGNWESVERYGTKAAQLAPDDVPLQAIATMIAYRKALQDRNDVAKGEAIANARRLVESDPSLVTARRVVLDDLMRRQELSSALEVLDAGIAATPDTRDFYQMRAAILYQLGDGEALEAQLLDLVKMNPADQDVQNSLISWYVSQNRNDAAEEFLRQRIADAPDRAGAQTRLVAFIAQTRGNEAARAELDAIIDAAPADAAPFRAMRAGLDFDAGRADEAMAELRAVIDAAPEGETSDPIRVTLARMMASTGNQVGARQLVEEVLARNASQPEAMKLRAGWLIDDDKTGDALIALRAALDRNPRDPEIMTLMARAHERDGSRDLMGEMLSLAVAASEQAPAESLRYAAWLESDGKYLPAEDALINALRKQPQNPDLLAALGRVYVGMRDWARTEQVVNTLREVGSDATNTAANELTASRLAAQNQDQELVGFLQGLAAEGQGNMGAELALIRTSLLRGDVNGALTQSTALLERNPEDPTARFLNASVLLSAGQPAEAEASLRKLTEDAPQFEPAWTGLYGLLRQQDRGDEAMAVLDAGIKALPESVTLPWTRAGALEQAGDIDGAIAVYEELYARDSNAAVIANNLASLLSSYRDDPESLERAFTVARRLRGAQLPAFKDTYGWIAFRRGNYDEALAHLEPAAQALPQDPAVRYHLAMTYGAVGRTEDALNLLRPLETEGAAANEAPRWLEPVRAEIARLTAAPAPADATGSN
ncbi:tetratricopeptide repeat protein [Cereibacter sp. SYSU M97828]|nr:tetratricopeptide repeat protein [Cereibacter flavus]